jgi:4-hydroxy-tetrahydrodipicolinate reductase
MVKLAINGAAGRMGRRVTALAIEGEKFDLVCALEAAGLEVIGSDVGEIAGVGAYGLTVTTSLDDATSRPDVMVDFSLPEGTMKFLPTCRKDKIALVTGTTGLMPSHQAEVADAAAVIPIVQTANFSVGVNVLLKAAAMIARALGSEYDVEVAEVHHRFKKDAPSGTAISLARSICAALGKEYGDAAVLGRGGHCPRGEGEIGMHAIRVGDTIGEHTVYFGNLGETVTIGHSAHTRDTFVRGALRAAEWVVGRPPGLYTMQDVLGLK